MHSLAVSKFADRDSQEVQGYLETLGNVFDEYAKLPLREGVIKSLHRELLKYAQKDTGHRGEYKHKENIVGVLGKDGTIAHILFETTPAYLTAKEMSELVEWASDALEQNRFHPLLVIANFVIEFLKIHPFEDGNGRLSRILTNLLLLRSGYSFAQYVSHEQMIEHRKDEYYFALRASQATFRTQHKPEGAKETIAPWLNYFLGIISEQATKALTYLGEEQVEDTLSAKQRAVWKHIVTVGDVNLGELVAATGINRATVRQALLRLVELGKIKRTGRGRATRYVKVSS